MSRYDCPEVVSGRASGMLRLLHFLEDSLAFGESLEDVFLFGWRIPVGVMRSRIDHAIYPCGEILGVFGRARFLACDGHVNRAGGCVDVVVENGILALLARGAQQAPAAFRKRNRACEVVGVLRTVLEERFYDPAVANHFETVHRNDGAQFRREWRGSLRSIEAHF